MPTKQHRRLTKREIHTFHDHLSLLAVCEPEVWRTLAALVARIMPQPPFTPRKGGR